MYLGLLAWGADRGWSLCPICSGPSLFCSPHLHPHSPPTAHTPPRPHTAVSLVREATPKSAAAARGEPPRVKPSPVALVLWQTRHGRHAEDSTRMPRIPAPKWLNLAPRKHTRTTCLSMCSSARVPVTSAFRFCRSVLFWSSTQVGGTTPLTICLPTWQFRWIIADVGPRSTARLSETGRSFWPTLAHSPLAEHSPAGVIAAQPPLCVAAAGLTG